MIKYLGLLLCVISCSVVAPKKENTQSSESHLYKLNFKNAASEIKTILLSLGVTAEKAVEEEGKGKIITNWIPTQGTRFPLEQRLMMEYRYENPDYTFVKVTSELQTQTSWDATLGQTLQDQIDHKQKELSQLEEKRNKLEILELEYQKEKEELEIQIKALEQKRREDLFSLTSEKDLKYLYESIQKIFSLAEDMRGEPGGEPQKVLKKKEAAYHIWKLAEDHRFIIPKIILFLNEKDSKIRAKAAMALWAIGKGPMAPPMIKEARRALKKTLKDSDPEIREYVQKALKRLMEGGIQ